MLMIAIATLESEADKTFMMNLYQEYYGLVRKTVYKKIEFTNAQGSLITYIELSSGNKPALDTENASVFETIDINEYKGTVVVKNSLATIIWAMDDRMFMIQGKIDKDTSIKMAEGVKYVD